MRKSVFIKIACIVSFCLITGVFSIVESNAAENTGAQNYLSENTEALKNSSGYITNDFVTLRYYCGFPPGTEGVIGNLSEVEVYKELEKRTNIKISFIHASFETQRDKFMIMMAAGDLPDLVELPWSLYPGLLSKAVEVGVLRKLDSLIENNAPNFNGILLSDDEIRKQLADDDGAIYRFPGLNRAVNKVGLGPVIRGDLLKKLGLAVPETIDEWEKVLKLFRDSKVCKTPLSFDMSVLNYSRSFMGAFGINMDFCLDNGKVVYGPIEKSYKDFLSAFNRWYRTGLIDREFTVMKKSQIEAKIIKGEVGAFIGTVSDLEKVMKAVKASEAEYEFIAVPNPVLHRGDKLTIANRLLEVNPASGVVVTMGNKYPVESVKWLDYAYGEEGHRLFSYGIEGKTYKMENGQPKFTDLIMNNAEGLSKSQAMGKYLRSDTLVPGYRTDVNIESGYEYNEPKTALKIWSGNTDEKLNEMMPPISLTFKENNEIYLVMNDIYSYVNKAFLKTVLAAEPLDNFDKYADELRKMGIDKATQIMQTALDRYNNRLAAGQIKMELDGELIEMDTHPIVVNGKVLVPVRFIIEALGGSVEWDAEVRSVTVEKSDVNMIFIIDSPDVMANGSLKSLETSVLLRNSRTYIPADFISKGFGVDVDWDETGRTVKFSSKN